MLQKQFFIPWNNPNTTSSSDFMFSLSFNISLNFSISNLIIKNNIIIYFISAENTAIYKE